MNDLIAQILEIEIALRGDQAVKDGIEDISQEMETLANKTADLFEGIALIATAATVAFAGVKAGMEQEYYEDKFEGLTGSAKEAAAQMEMIDRIASKGIFKEKDIFNAVTEMNKFGVSVRDNITLVEALGARAGSMSSAAQLVGAIESGMTTGLMKRLQNFGIGPDKLKEAGLNVQGGQIKNTTQEILQALSAIEAVDKTLEALQGNLISQTERMHYQFGELLATIGAPFIEPFTKVLGLVTEIFRWIKDLNIVTNSWVSNFILGGLFITGLIKVIAFLKEIAILEKLIAFWAGIRNVLQSGPALIAGLGKVIQFLRTMFTIEKILVAVETARAFLAAAMAAALGNIPGALTALALIAAAGFGAHAAINAVDNYRDSQAKNAQERPIRRDDWQRAYNKAYGDSWTG